MALIILFASPFIAVLCSLLAGKRQVLIEAIAVASATIECIACLWVVARVVAERSYSFGPYLSLHALEALILGLTVIVGLVATLTSVGYLRGELAKNIIGIKRVKECYMLMRLFLLSMFVAIATANPIIMWLAVEGTTLSTVFLVSFFNRRSDLEAAWKYLIINSVGLLFGLLGTVLFLSLGGVSHCLTTWNDLLHVATHMDASVVKIAFVLLFIGYGTKMGLVPLHTWKPDAYNKAPLPVVALLSSALLNVALLALLRFKLVTDLAVGASFTQGLFIAAGIFSIALPAFIMYSQANYKRLLAYSSIEQAGIMLLGFGFGGIGILGALLQMIYHSLTKSLLFLLSGNLAVKYSTSKIKELTGILATMPYTGAMMLLGLISLTGIPPFGMFISELYIAIAGFRHNVPLTIVIIALLLLAFASLFRHGMSMFFSTPPEGIKQGELGLWTIVPPLVLVAILLLMSLYIPPFMQQLLKESAALFAANI